MQKTKKMLALALIAALCAFSCPALSAGSSRLGKAMPDFTVETVNAGTFSLSEALKEKEAVLINLWATWCGPCEMEFPYLQKAYELYDDVVAVIALSVERSDSPEVLKAYAQEHALTFPIGSDTTVDLSTAFDVYSIPTSIIVDRFGNVAFIEAGAQPSVSAFTRLFDAFTGESYTETRVLNKIPPAKPVMKAAEQDLSAALNAEGGQIAFVNERDETVWPMLPVEKDGRTAVASSNAGYDDTAAGLTAQVRAAEGEMLAFDFATDTEDHFDLLVILVDGERQKSFGGAHGWTAWVLPLEAGDHRIAFRYEKDASGSQGDDAVWLDNVRLVSGQEAQALLSALPVYPTAEEISMQVVTEGAREIRFVDPDGVMAQYYGSRSYWIVPGGTAEAFITITKDIDPESAFLYGNYDRSLVFLPAAQTEGGYVFSTGMHSMDTTGSPDTTIFLYPYISAQLEELTYITLFSSGDDVDLLISSFAEEGYALTWTYADGASAE